MFRRPRARSSCRRGERRGERPPARGTGARGPSRAERGTDAGGRGRSGLRARRPGTPPGSRRRRPKIGRRRHVGAACWAERRGTRAARPRPAAGCVRRCRRNRGAERGRLRARRGAGGLGESATEPSARWCSRARSRSRPGTSSILADCFTISAPSSRTHTRSRCRPRGRAAATPRSSAPRPSCSCRAAASTSARTRSPARRRGPAIPTKIAQNAAALAASAKDREEHAIVVEAMAETLRPFCEELAGTPSRCSTRRRTCGTSRRGSAAHSATPPRASSSSSPRCIRPRPSAGHRAPRRWS